jgi:hypothetical protein
MHLQLRTDQPVEMHMLRTASAGHLRHDHSMPGHVHDDMLFLVHDGDLDVPGAIELDWKGDLSRAAFVEQLAPLMDSACGTSESSAAKMAVRGLLVTGSLRISGELVNASPDAGATLIVLGDLTARQASCGGSCIHIGGDAHIEDVLYAHGNDGELHVGGRVFAKALVNDDHAVLIGGNSQVQAPNPLQIIDLREIGSGEDGEQVPKELKKVLGDTALGLSSVAKALRDCRPSASLGKPQAPREWKDVIWKDLNAIRKLPKHLRTEEMYLLLLAADCTLSEPEIHELVSKIPKAMLSERVRMAAFLLCPKSLLRLPPKFDLQEEYARCLSALTNPESYIGDIPTHLLPVGWQRTS